MEQDMVSREQFLQDLRNTLNHLYEPTHLQESPLAPLLGVANQANTASALRRVLIEAIQSLRPGNEEPSRSSAWEVYDCLFYRYVEQLSQQEVADRMSISVRHFRRKQHASLEVLVDHLWHRYRLEERKAASPAGSDGEHVTTVDPAAGGDALQWLQNDTLTGVTHLDQTFPAVLSLAQKLTQRHDVLLKTERPATLPTLPADPVAVRQILLNLLSVVIPRAAGGRVDFGIRVLRWETEFRIRCAEYPSGPQSTLDDEATSLKVAERLAGLCRGKLTLEVDAVAFDARLVLPTLEQLPVLVIDDDKDTLQLLQRYAAKSRYHLITTREPAQAMDMVAQFEPQVIVLDVMMPHMDGWEVLGNLRQHPLTSRLPIIVCTILAQKELANLLGASAFLQKPVTRQDFLTALDRQMVSLASPTARESG